MDGMKSQDIVVLLKLMSLQEDDQQSDVDLRETRGNDVYSVRNLGALLAISKTEINASINRCMASGLLGKDRESGRPKPMRANPPSLCFFP